MSSAALVSQQADLTVALKRATMNGDAAGGLSIAKRLFGKNPEWVLRDGSPEQYEIHACSHEVYAEFLQLVVFAESNDESAWVELSLPRNSHFPMSVLLTNARWLRDFGSKLPDIDEQELHANALAKLGFERQAKLLGRYCAINDGARPIDYAAVSAALDPRLRAVFAHWLITVYLASPGNLAAGRIASQQAEAAQAFITRHSTDSSELAASGMMAHIPNKLCYRSDIEVEELASILNGQLTRRMVSSFRANSEDPTDGQLAELLPKGGRLIICPNWREEHVAFRCMSALTEGMRGPKTRVLMVHESSTPSIGRPAPGWEAETINFKFSGRKHFVGELAGLANVIEQAELDFVFYPEITPNNATTWLATQRLAQVQATGYGYPITTGSPNMDYFVGGSAVESKSPQYTEELRLLPGLGVSTTRPPLPTRPRQRPLEGPEVRLASITSWQKLTPALIQTWEAILAPFPHASLDVFTGLSVGQARTVASEMARHIHTARINIHLSVPRTQILDTLEDADVYLDSFPYCGFNSLVEVLAAGCPTVTLEGEHARQRFGAAILRRLGLPENQIAHTAEEYVQQATKLIEDTDHRLAVRAALGSRDAVLEALCDDNIGSEFGQLVNEWLNVADD